MTARVINQVAVAGRRVPSAPLTSFVLSVLFLLYPPIAGALSVTASVEQSQLAVGESTMLSIAFEGAQNVGAPNITVPGFQVRYVGPNTQVSFVNGAVSASVTHRYQLVARQEGPVTVGPFSIEYDGQRYQTQAIQMTVTPPGRAPQLPGGSASGGTDVYLTLQPGKNEMFLGERVPLVIRLLVGRARVDDVQFPQITLDGIAMDKLPQPRQMDEVVQGRRFTVLRFDTMITPLRAGTVALGPAAMGMSLMVNRRGDPFGGFFAQGQPFEAHAVAVPLTVKPLPDAGRPAGFSGAIGKFDFTLDARPTELAAGDPVTIRTEISGTGNLNGVEAPRVRVDDRFRAYDPVPINDGDQAGKQGFEQVIIPKNPGDVEIAPLQFSYFDPESGRYETITRGPIRLAVGAAAQAPSAAVFSMEKAAEPARPAEKLGRDIVFIKDAPGDFVAPGAGFQRSAGFVLLQLLPPSLFGVTAFLLRRRERLLADPRLVRFRQAGKEVRGRLSALGGAQGADFYDGLSGALRDYLAAKLDLPPGAVEAPRVLERLARAPGLADVHDQLDDLFRSIERVRYAPSGSDGADRAGVLRSATKIVDRLEREKALSDRFAAGVGLIAAACSAAVVATALDPNGEFYRGNQLYKEGKYAEAAAAYEAILTEGTASGALYFNLANANMKNGAIGKAILSYERAARLLPGDPDVRANLAYAREEAKDEVDERALWRRLAFPLADRMTTSTLAWLWTASWAFVWMVLGARLAVPAWRTGLGRVGWAAAGVAVFVGASFLDRVVEVELTSAAVVIRPGATAVRFEPAETGTEHFKVTEGTKLEVTAEESGWLQVRRADGRRGWISAADVGRV